MIGAYFKKTGSISLLLLILAGASLILITGFALMTSVLTAVSRFDLRRLTALSTAEAGIEYYRWHLAHYPTDYTDGTGNPGPYIHDYYDKDGNRIGSFSLEIVPPPLGSTIVTITSAGVPADSSVKKIVRARLGILSYARYAWLINGAAAFADNAEIFGPAHANGGIRFDGLAHNLVTSARSQYRDPDHGGKKEFGVHTHKNPVDPFPPAAVPSRPDVFIAGRQFPAPALDFTRITQNLAAIKKAAQDNGFYASSSAAFGYEVVLKTDNTFDLYRVTALTQRPSGCSSSKTAKKQSGWGTWSVKTETLLGNHAFPANGLAFFYDNVWVRGTVSGGRITIASGRFPDIDRRRSNIIVNDHLRYTNYDGRDAIGLIAQNNITIGLKSADNLRVDAALVAQSGRIGRYSYNSKCGDEKQRASLESFGMLASNKRPQLYYAADDGYQDFTYRYDGNLLFGPPPSFPPSGSQIVPISWDELR